MRLIDTHLGHLQETGGISCALVHHEKALPWHKLDKELLDIGCYVAGWPRICLPVMSTQIPDMISLSDYPSYWRLEQWLAMEIQINKDAVRVLARPKGHILRVDGSFTEHICS